ncbi:DUF262 domain-containing protein [Leptospira sp. GIMC2001]|uniref:DUF262 domain-containing protein n=1 Tax=Leptospira sp. GIMC2001 TaxID=1513297 RepID=UPI002349D3F4|nr:DUF262 domain-containing HNH endonuclease family protein [Leptospira sp. GIMC2001]WCL50803.1 DUF262 domain-containing HNH endonuclease family protein [Leptospira sp. GIMC2001]
MKITSIDRNIKKLFDSGFYRIPRFQRPYSWDRDNLDEFWNDVKENESGDYFLGSMVVYKHDGESYNLVDGQQRLTTITILLCTIRNRFSELLQKNLASGIHNIIERADINNKHQYIIQTETSYPYFQEHIQKFGQPDVNPSFQNEERRLKEAYDFFKEKLLEVAKTNKEKEIQSLKNLRDKILSLSFVYIELDNEEDAYIIFETLNTRGKDLSASDLIKNLYTKLIKNQNKHVDLVKDKWKKLVENIQDISSSTQIDQFMLHYWLSQGKYINLKNLYKNYKKTVTKNTAKTSLDELIVNSEYYKEVLIPNKNNFSKQEYPLYDSIKAMTIFGLLQNAPLSLAIFRHYKNKIISMKMAKDWFNTIEKFHYIYTAITSSRSTGGMSSLHAGAARNLANEIDKDKISKQLKEFKGKLKTKFPEYNLFLYNFQNLNFTSSQQKDKKLVQYTLKKLLEHHVKNSPLTIDYENLTIEHLAPENPSQGKKSKVKNIGSIGNLLFISTALQNKLKNKAFEEKLKIIKNEKFPIDSYLNNMNIINDKEVKKRTDYLAKILYEDIFSL